METVVYVAWQRFQLSLYLVLVLNLLFVLYWTNLGLAVVLLLAETKLHIMDQTCSCSGNQSRPSDHYSLLYIGLVNVDCEGRHCGARPNKNRDKQKILIIRIVHFDYLPFD